MINSNIPNDLQDTIQQIYTKNINFLQNNHKNIYQKLISLQNTNQQNYSIDFIDNHFDLVDKNGNYTYNCDPFYDSNHRVSQLDKTSCFSLISLKPYNKTTTIKDAVNSYNFVNDFQKNIIKEPKITNKFIFIGTMLGVHINDIHRNCNCLSYLIVEPCIEIFNLSLFLTDYTELLSSAKIFFAIGDDISDDIEKFLQYKNKYNNYIKFELASTKELPLIEKLSSSFISFNQMQYPFCQYLQSLENGYIYFEQNGILDMGKNYDILDKKPILFIGAGPSLEQNKDFVSKNKDKFTIICASGALRRLQTLDIIPNIILTIDGQNRQVVKQFEVDEKYYINSIIIASIKTNLEVFKIIKKANLFFVQDSLELFENYGILTGVTVGDVGLDIILRLGAKNIYMLGFDASVTKQGLTHDSSSWAKKQVDTKNDYDIIQNDGIDTTKYLCEVKGNFQKTVKTFLFYKDMIKHIDSLSLSKNSNVNIFNLSDGAYFYDCIPTKADKLNLDSFKDFDKNTINKQIISSLNSIKKTKLNQKDISDIKKEKKIVQKLMAIKSTNYEKIAKKLILNYPNSTALQILDNFFKLIDPYHFVSKNKDMRYWQLLLIIKKFKSIYL
jgi:hypothetical protein